MSEPTSITVTLDLDKYLATFPNGVGPDGEGGQPTTIEDVVLHLAAQDVLKRLALGDDYGRSDLRRRISAIRDEAIRAHVEPLVAEALGQPIQPTDAYGTPQGKPMSVPEMVKRETDRALTSKGDGFSKQGTLLERIVREEVDRRFTSEVKQAIDEAKADVLTAVRAKGAEVLAETMRRALP